MFTIQMLFQLAMKRDVNRLINPFGHDDLSPSPKTILHLGAGQHHIPDTVALDFPDWDADADPLPYRAEEVDHILAFHFMEHVADPISLLIECQRVLRPGGTMTICVPYYTSQMQAHDLTHKHVFCEETWRNLFAPDYVRYVRNRYSLNRTLNPVKWELSVHFNIIMGVVERNLALLTQLVKRVEE